jgi:hypothetical protein|tara:strand:+ start:1061 stop:1522 length:462 start_codon:yes stop_codon:yes gene_type:complete
LGSDYAVGSGDELYKLFDRDDNSHTAIKGRSSRNGRSNNRDAYGQVISLMERKARATAEHKVEHDRAAKDKKNSMQVDQECDYEPFVSVLKEQFVYLMPLLTFLFAMVSSAVASKLLDSGYLGYSIAAGFFAVGLLIVSILSFIVETRLRLLR